MRLSSLRFGSGCAFVEQIRRHGLDPFDYFEWLFGKLMPDPGPGELEVNSVRNNCPARECGHWDRLYLLITENTKD